MRRLILAVTLGLMLAAPAAAAPALPAHAPLALVDPLEDKLFYLFRLLTAQAEVRRALVADPALGAARTAYLARLATADRTCAIDAACYANAARLTPTEVDALAAGLRRLYAASPGVRRVADVALPASGIVAPGEDGAGELEAAWREHAQAINRIIDTYGLGLPPQAPQIDAPAEKPAAPRLRLVGAIVLERDLQPAWSPAEVYARLLLRAEGRDEAGRHEPLEAGENAAAVKRMKSLAWSRYPYAAIVVPGAGPDRDGERLSAMGELRLELAVARWQAGKAPFLLVSGGYVHPARTPFAEAIEMKRYLMKTFAVPEDAILVDPHARHTTTNLRNAARILWRDGAPAERKVLVVSDEQQTAYMASPVFDQRNRAETGVLPYRDKKQLGRFELEIVPSPEALRLNPLDPLDP